MAAEKVPLPGLGEPPAPAGPFLCKMPVVCSWCGVTIEVKPANRPDVSGGICRICLEEKLAALQCTG